MVTDRGSVFGGSLAGGVLLLNDRGVGPRAQPLPLTDGGRRAGPGGAGREVLAVHDVLEFLVAAAARGLVGGRVVDHRRGLLVGRGGVQQAGALALGAGVHQHRAVGLGQGQRGGHEGRLLVAQQAGAQALAPLVEDGRRVLLLVAGVGGREPRAELLAGRHGGHEAGGGFGHHRVLRVVGLAPQAPVGGAADQRGVILIGGLRLDGWDWGREKHTGCAHLSEPRG